MHRLHTKWYLILLMLLQLQPALAITFPEKPPNTDYFVDQALLMDDASQQSVNEIASKLLKEEAIPIFVVTISSLSNKDAANLSIEEYAAKLFNHWGIGRQSRNYGMLLLVSRGDRKARIELGEGWAGQHDAEARNVMQQLIIPAFKRDDYSTGIADGVRGMDAMARGLGLPKPTPPAWFWPAVILGGIGLVFLIFNLFKTGRSGWAWALIALIGTILFFVLRAAMNSSGSSGGFGGGSAGGGGATGSW